MRGSWRERAAWGTLAVLLGAGASTMAPAENQVERFDTVILDAGHGGSDDGAVAPSGRLEKNVALDVTLALAKRLRARGLRVVLTRDDDTFVPLEARTSIANDARGDLFVSIHANAARDRRIHGSETYFLALEASDSDAAGVAARENASFGEGESEAIAALSDPFIALLGDMISTEHLEESSVFAKRVQRELATLPIKSRGVKQALFVVLTGVQMPAALVEIGFVTHPGDEAVISGSKGRERIVTALEKAVVAFGQRYDARRGLGAAAPERP